MAVNTRVIPAPRERVWATLIDGFGYGDWVVGTSGIREVDTGFPAVGTRLHYRIGHGPLRHDGHTEVHDVVDGHRLDLEAHAWPVGTASIVLTLADHDAGCLVTIEEQPARGVPKVLHNPLQDAVIKLRNVETLRRLERRTLRGG